MEMEMQMKIEIQMEMQIEMEMVKVKKWDEGPKLWTWEYMMNINCVTS